MMRSVFDFDKHEVVAALRDQRARTLALLEALSPEQWEVEVTPGWRTREVAAHLVSTDEAALTGRMLALGIGSKFVGIEALEAWNDRQVKRWAEHPIPALLVGLERWGRRMARLARLAPEAVARAAVPGPFGRVSPLWLVSMRVYDEWVHCEDVRRALSLPPDDGRASVRPVARHLLAGVPIQTLPRLTREARGRVELSFTDLDLPTVVVDLAARRVSVESGGEARVTGPAAPLVMIAARRDPWRTAEQQGVLKLEGDRRVAETLLDALVLV